VISSAVWNFRSRYRLAPPALDANLIVFYWSPVGVEQQSFLWYDDVLIGRQCRNPTAMRSSGDCLEIENAQGSEDGMTRPFVRGQVRIVVAHETQQSLPARSSSHSPTRCSLNQVCLVNIGMGDRL
jgi:hypothetical protein